MTLMLRVMIVGSLACAAACSAPDAEHDAPSLPPASDSTLRAAERALAAFLEASREGTATAAALDTLARCGDGGGVYLPSPVLAAFTVLPATGGGDTLVGRALAVTVAEQDEDRRQAGRFVARLRVRADTLEWDLVRGDDDASWRVCNGLRFGYPAPDALTTWRPDGASYAAMRALADSVHRAWEGRP